MRLAAERQGAGPYPKPSAPWPREVPPRWGRSTHGRAAALAPRRRAYHDKMPLIFLHVGLILPPELPNARIILPRLDPVEIPVFSCFFSKFSLGGAALPSISAELGRSSALIRADGVIGGGYPADICWSAVRGRG